MPTSYFICCAKAFQQQQLKRVFDFTIALLGIIVCFPIYIAIMSLVKIASPGPIIYVQLRVGLNGKLFSLYKFRSMVNNADQMGTSVTTGMDPRINRVGKFLRKSKLDELPQLWNVLKGDMSLVGPRPDVPEIVNSYSNEMRKILDVRPGITSNATLHLRNEEDLLSLAEDPDKAYEVIIVPAKIKLAMEHVYKRSFLFDFHILIQTIWVLTFGKVWPLKEHPFITQIKMDIDKLNNNHKEVNYLWR